MGEDAAVKKLDEDTPAVMEEVHKAMSATITKLSEHLPLLFQGSQESLTKSENMVQSFLPMISSMADGEMDKAIKDLKEEQAAAGGDGEGLMKLVQGSKPKTERTRGG